jgi:hypothetical protein
MLQLLSIVLTLFSQCGAAVPDAPGYGSRFLVCLQIGTKAEISGVDSAIPIGLAMTESGFLDVTRKNGVTGPLQITPKYLCPKVGECDPIQVGVDFLKSLLQKHSLRGTLCVYAHGPSKLQQCLRRECTKTRYINLVESNISKVRRTWQDKMWQRLKGWYKT